MTRFARAHGSKAANERIPEEATSWNQMKKQLEYNKQRLQDAEEKAKCESLRKENYEKFLNEEKAKSIQKSWCEFDDPSSSSSNLNNKKDIQKKVKKSKKGKKNESVQSENIVNSENESEAATLGGTKENENSCEEMDADDEELSKWCDEKSDGEIEDQYSDLVSKLSNILDKTKKRKSSTQKISENQFEVTKNVENKDIEVASENDEVPKKKKKKKKNIDNEPDPTNEPEKKCSKRPLESETLPNEKNKAKKLKKNKSKEIEDDANDAVEKITEEFQKIEATSTKKKKKRKLDQVNDDDSALKSESVNLTAQSCNLPENPESKSQKKKKRKNNAANIDSQPGEIVTKDKNNKQNQNLQSQNTKNSNDKGKAPGEFARRKPFNEETSILIVNGEKLEVILYDGFPILVRDAERLRDLRKSLVSKGIPRSEVNRTMKLERRKAEKSLSKMKKKLCFHCRKGGHNLSECPELNKKTENIGMPSSGICFKCGSTEHTHFACKVVRSDEYKFAQCFICKEQGHITRQCPDNPRGLYPKGGGCRECGDVTHLKKDCPKILQEREDNTMKLDILESNNIEDISQKQTVKSATTPKVKHVKF